MNAQAPLIASIEAGGTKFNVAIGTGPDDIRASTRIDTTEPQTTLRKLMQWLAEACRTQGAIKAIGVGSFGPVDLDPKSGTYGYITTTPKPGWSHTPLLETLHSRFQVPMGFDTDVNAAAIGESVWGAGRGHDPLVYITVGTGIGGGVMIDGKPLHGLLHPEIGHLHVPAPRTPGVIVDKCQCPFHTSCLEGFASGTAIAARWGIKGQDMRPDHPAWEEVADVLAHGLVNVILTLSPKRIILGGGVMHQHGLIDAVRSCVLRHLNGYIHVPALLQHIDTYIVPPGLGDRAGIAGGFALAMDALSRSL
jgi:fructokinase